MSPRSDYLGWKRANTDVGCYFARTIANRPRFYRQAIEIVGANSSPKLIAKSVADRISRLVAAPEVAAATLLFPQIQTLEQLAKAMVGLHSHELWEVKGRALTHEDAGELAAIAINRQIPNGEDATMPSEALVFGPFAVFPLTRRAPVVAMEIFVGPCRATEPNSDKPTTKANLAHLEMNGLSHGAFLTMWNRSKAGRLASLGGKEDDRAKAKVALVVPAQLGRELGLIL